MEIRLGSLLLAAALLSGCGWFHRGERQRSEEVSDASPADSAIVEPQVTRRDVKASRIKAKDIEVGGFVGALSIEDFGTNSLYGLRGAYHVSEDFFFEAFVASSKAGNTYASNINPLKSVTTNAGKYFSYYDLDAGYNVLPGEIFLGRGRAINSALYLSVGVGDVKFAENHHFALNFGLGERLLVTDWLAVHLDVRDHVFESTLTGRAQNLNNIEATVGLTAFF
ncbi:MAG: outer membrane beta-barrel domain-containing protein [Pseudomonadota bacterium]|nr:outer membrane beta-barrel domain-containing protein [Pseudomonadota bacterium]